MALESHSNPMAIPTLIHLFPQLSPAVVTEVVASLSDGSHDWVQALEHLLLLSPSTHWIQAVLREAQQQPLLVLLRGLPGSGKTTLAEILAQLKPDSNEICSADNFFIGPDGVYVYFHGLIKKAHEWCQNKAKKAMRRKKQLVMIDNTHTVAWEMEVYCRLAKEYNYAVLVVEPDTPWRYNPTELAQKTRHGVPVDKIMVMAQRYERDLTIENICASIPRHLQPKMTSLKSLIRRHAVISPEPVSEPKPSTSPKPQDADFQSIMQCFPTMNIEEIFPLYLQSQGDMNRAVNLILEHQADLDNALERDAPEEFSLVLDAEFAAKLEASFGSVRKSGNFPGAMDCKIPKSLAKVIFGYWKRDYASQLTLAKAEELEQVKKGSLFSTAMNRKPSVSPSFKHTNGIALGNGVQKMWTADVLEPASQEVSRQDIDILKAKRAECYQKAARAFKGKKGGEAFYYSDEGRRLTSQIESMESNYRYQTFVQSNEGRSTNSIDLHGFSVEEALENLEWFLDLKQGQLDRSVYATSHLEVITGRGSQSKAKIKPAAIKYLEERGLSFNEINQGSLRVLIKRNSG
ncbi:hypothetical protein TCAL_08818 [Tigriopus californicus]|uniref:Smr domain-containing protein n=1 Tax=Tigriopus californicus TaxID=6832 RepID=A0A553PTD2_TIGCA|nr:uncharacterized protein LOC131891419 [Tigriopus californicus]TRY80927.1 hypothetical protein TCAL_08818 [Tigriopus californicus]|eukprot:TCALIF_08818-PA protein Name:"Similar to N4bp2l1 NEDD4-binding protein 2-like 1 (Mus musculus)" AED:0.26 eAED:0.29 QI:0/0/0/0.66/1/1/3/0/573